ncbi:MAG: sodium:solute symporter [Acidobacteriota bacterium]
MSELVIPWSFFLLYVTAIIGLTWWQRRGASSLQAFAVGSRSVPPLFVGLSLAANLTSVATFVINPGLVHAYGWAGIVGYGLAAPAGIFVGLIVTSRNFRRVGDQLTALTVPQWIGDRFGDQRIRVFFGAISLLQVSFLVLIVTALVHVLMSVLQLPLWAALLIVITFTFGYILLGGASVHVWSNSLQAVTMLVVAVLLVLSGWSFFTDGLGGFVEQLRAVGPYYASWTNPSSLLFRDFFEVVIANFVIGLAIIMQPHIMSKSLYLRSGRDVNRYLLTAILAGTVFTTVLVVGLFARLELGAAVQPDKVVATYLVTHFGPWLRSLIMLGVLAAGFSTLEGVTLALSSIFANDLYGGAARLRGIPAEDLQHSLLKVGRLFLVGLAPVTLILAWWQVVNPTLSVAIFAQNGIYALFAATFAPVLFGIFSKRATKGLVFSAALLALVVHFGMYYGGITQYHNNPAVPAAFAIVSSTLLMAVGSLMRNSR